MSYFHISLPVFSFISFPCFHIQFVSLHPPTFHSYVVFLIFIFSFSLFLFVFFPYFHISFLCFHISFPYVQISFSRPFLFKFVMCHTLSSYFPLLFFLIFPYFHIWYMVETSSSHFSSFLSFFFSYFICALYIHVIVLLFTMTFHLTLSPDYRSIKPAPFSQTICRHTPALVSK